MTRIRLLLLLTALILSACGSTPAEPEPVPELNLNLPPAECKCQEEQQADFTFLEKGFAALHDGEYLESLQYFQRYQRIEQSAIADIEARIAIAYLSILPQSPIFDSAAARDSYREIRQDIQPDWQLHPRVQVMQDSLESFLDMQAELSELERDNRDLRKELQRREEAIKRLRDLTLGRDPQ
jgi:hypothetical protein